MFRHTYIYIQRKAKRRAKGPKPPVNKYKMSLFDPKDLMNEIYQSALALGVASGINMVLQKFTKISLGTPMNLRPFVMLAVSLGIGQCVLKILEKKYKIPTEPFKTN